VPPAPAPGLPADLADALLSLLDEVDEALAWFDADGLMRWCNPAAARGAGLAPGQGGAAVATLLGGPAAAWLKAALKAPGRVETTLRTPQGRRWRSRVWSLGTGRVWRLHELGSGASEVPLAKAAATRQAPAAPNLAAVVTASEIEGVRQKIRPCWNTQGGSRDQAMIITLTVEMNQNGTPVKAELRDTGRYNSDPVFRAAADAAHRAIMNPRCQPWPLSPEKFTSWRTIIFNFDPRDY